MNRTKALMMIAAVALMLPANQLRAQPQAGAQPQDLLVWPEAKGVLAHRIGVSYFEEKFPTVTLHRWPDPKNVLGVDYHFRGGTWCGIYINFRAPVDVGARNAFSFWICGKRGAEVVIPGLKDTSIPDNAQAVHPMHPLSKYLAKGKVTTTWEKVIIPFDDFQQLDPKQKITSIVFEVEAQGSKGMIYLEDIAFIYAEKKKEKEPPPPAKNDGGKTPAPPPKKRDFTKLVKVPEVSYANEKGPLAENKAQDPAFRRAMWVWDPEVASDPLKQKFLFSFCGAQGSASAFRERGKQLGR